MRRVTQADIVEMKGRGYEAETIRGLEQDLKRTLEADELCEMVRDAFAGVRLGDGVGLFEGQALDDYATEEVRAEARAKDETHDWESIEAKHLNACQSSLSFFDAPGMRFHLPAFIIADLKGEFGMGMEFYLTHLNYYSREKFALLDPGQRRVVRKYLQFLRSDIDSQLDYDHIDRALSDYWIEPL